MSRHRRRPTPPLVRAVRNGDLCAVQKLLDSGGCDLNATDADGRTAVYEAAKRNHADIVLTLAKAGADLSKAKDGLTPLHVAAATVGSSAALNALLGAECDTDVATPNPPGSTAIHLAVQYGHTAAVELLCEAGCRVDARRGDAKTALHLAAYEGLAEAVVALLAARADCRLADNCGMTPLHWAALAGRAQVVEILLTAPGCPREAVSRDGSTALHMACAENHADVAGILVRARCNLEAVRKDGLSAARLADAHQGLAAELVGHKGRSLLEQGGISNSFAYCIDQLEFKDCEIFISYQWDSQAVVRRLYEALTLRRYSCWMDVHRMGGGDCLGAKIEKGVSGCKVFLACMTPRYTESDICQREVSLAKSRKKPIIPLIFEPLPIWPPGGPMGLVMPELIYIPMCDSPAELNSWDGEQSQKLYNKVLDIMSRPGRSASSSPNSCC